MVELTLFPPLYSFRPKSLHSWGLEKPSPSLRPKRPIWPSWGRSILLGHFLQFPSFWWPQYHYFSSLFLPKPLLHWRFLCPFLLLGGNSGLEFRLLPIFFTALFYPLSRPNERLPSFNIQKTCWNKFVLHFDSHCSPERKYYSLSFFLQMYSLLVWHCAQLNFSFLLGASKVNLKPGGLLKWKKQLGKNSRFWLRSQKWWRAQTYISDSRQTSSVMAKPRLRHGAAYLSSSTASRPRKSCQPHVEAPLWFWHGCCHSRV